MKGLVKLMAFGLAIALVTPIPAPAGKGCRTCLICCSKTIDLVTEYGPAVAALAATVVATIPGIPNQAVAAQWISVIQALGKTSQPLLKALSTACASTAAQLAAEDAHALAAAGVPIGTDGTIDFRFKALVGAMVAQEPTRSLEAEAANVVLPDHVVASNLHLQFARTLPQ
jgi:hypothetical protein